MLHVDSCGWGQCRRTARLPRFSRDATAHIVLRGAGQSFGPYVRRADQKLLSFNADGGAAACAVFRVRVSGSG
ncbi:hypothetical protein PF003_g6436 [Phytophthora fragariae]|nr:hypothetical protein PF003_g6436 [Phytophthora fragariae]